MRTTLVLMHPVHRMSTLGYADCMRFDSPQEKWPPSTPCAYRLWCLQIVPPKYISLPGFEVRPSVNILGYPCAPPRWRNDVTPTGELVCDRKVLRLSDMWCSVVWHNGCQYFGVTCPADVLSPSLYHDLDDHHVMTPYLTGLEWLSRYYVLSVKLFNCHSVLWQLCCFSIAMDWLKKYGIRFV